MPDTNFEHIEDYLNDALPPEEKERFEQRLEEDDSLREQLYAYKETENHLARRFNLSEEEQRFREALNKKNKQYFHTSSRVIPFASRRAWWASVASIAAAAAIIILIWSPWQGNLISRYGQLKMTLPTVRGSEQNSTLTRAARLFNAEKYEEALPPLDSAVQADPSNAQTRFYRGVTYMHMHQKVKARRDLQVVFEGHSIYKYQGAYFAALTFLAGDQKDSSRAWLQKIPEDAAVYPKAKKLLKHIQEEKK